MIALLVQFSKESRYVKLVILTSFWSIKKIILSVLALAIQTHRIIGQILLFVLIFLVSLVKLLTFQIYSALVARRTQRVQNSVISSVLEVQLILVLFLILALILAQKLYNSKITRFVTRPAKITK